MTVSRQDDLIDSVADALQFISYYHPLDYVNAVHRAWQREQNPAAKGAMAQKALRRPRGSLIQAGRGPITAESFTAAKGYGVVHRTIRGGCWRPQRLSQRNSLNFPSPFDRLTALRSSVFPSRPRRHRRLQFHTSRLK